MLICDYSKLDCVQVQKCVDAEEPRGRAWRGRSAGAACSVRRSGTIVPHAGEWPGRGCPEAVPAPRGKKFVALEAVGKVRGPRPAKRTLLRWRRQGRSVGAACPAQRSGAAAVALRQCPRTVTEILLRWQQRERERSRDAVCQAQRPCLSPVHP